MGKEEKVERYLHNNTQSVGCRNRQAVTTMYIYENIYNRIGKGKYKLR